MLLDLAPVVHNKDECATANTTVLQAAFDSGRVVELPPCTLVTNKPLYLSSGARVFGDGRQSAIRPQTGDALVAIPESVRRRSPAENVVEGGPFGSATWSFRTNGSAGLYFHQTIADTGRGEWDHWAACRGFAVDVCLTRHSGDGAIAGLAWSRGGSQYDPSPWILSQPPDTERLEHVEFRIACAETVHAYRFRLGPRGVAFDVRIRVDLDAGTVRCERDGLLLTGSDAVPLSDPIPPGATLAENRGAPLWVGGCTPSAGGACPPELGCHDCTIHAFRMWGTAVPGSATTANRFSWSSGTLFVLPFSVRPVENDPSIPFTGEQTGYGRIVPLADSSPHDRVVGDVRVAGVALDLTWPTPRFGAGLSLVSAQDVRLEKLKFLKGAVGVQVLSGPLPNYPVHMTGLRGDHQADCVVRLQRTIARDIAGLTAKYPARSVLRADACGVVGARDIFHAGENAGPSNTATDVFRYDSCGVVSLDGVLSNYEDGYGPRRSYVRATGAAADTGPRIVRVRDFARQSLRPGAAYLDTAGLSAGAVIEVLDSF